MDDRSEKSEDSSEKSESENSPEMEIDVRGEARESRTVLMFFVPFRADSEYESPDERHTA